MHNYHTLFLIVLPLTAENVASVFMTGVLTKSSSIRGSSGFETLSFGELLGIHGDLINHPLRAAAWWVRQGKDRRWRLIIYYLDDIGETELAEELMPYSEPPSGMMCTHALLLVTNCKTVQRRKGTLV